MCFTQVLDEKTHNLGGRNIDPKKANPRKKEEVIKKIFVGKVDPSLTEAEIKEYFETFGEVITIDLIIFLNDFISFVTFKLVSIRDIVGLVYWKVQMFTSFNAKKYQFQR